MSSGIVAVGGQRVSSTLRLTIKMLLMLTGQNR